MHVVAFMLTQSESLLESKSDLVGVSQLVHLWLSWRSPGVGVGDVWWNVRPTSCFLVVSCDLALTVDQTVILSFLLIIGLVADPYLLVSP